MSSPKRIRPRRAGFTLLELMLSLALVVVATALIGSLMQIFSRNFATRGEDIRREQLARAILNMIAEDIRSVVVEQEYDASILQQMLGGSGNQGGGRGGGASGGGDAGGSGGEEIGEGGLPAGDALGGSDSAFSPSLGSSMSSGTSADAASGDATELDSLSETVSTSSPPGLYGNQFSLMVDVSRIPRPDEYLGQQASLLEGNLTDVPGDMKTVTYFVQSSTNQGVDDSMAMFTAATAGGAGFSSGLVRRQLDRAVTAYAEETGDTDRLARTGDLVAPEVIALEFSYFDGTEWLLQWDSTSQSLPWLVQISLAMQSASASEQAQLEPGTPISTMTYADRAAYGIEVYELVVAIPGAQLRAADAASADQAAGMESLGL